MMNTTRILVLIYAAYKLWRIPAAIGIATKSGSILQLTSAGVPVAYSAAGSIALMVAGIAMLCRSWHIVEGHAMACPWHIAAAVCAAAGHTGDPVLYAADARTGIDLATTEDIAINASVCIAALLLPGTVPHKWDWALPIAWFLLPVSASMIIIGASLDIQILIYLAGACGAVILAIRSCACPLATGDYAYAALISRPSITRLGKVSSIFLAASILSVLGGSLCPGEIPGLLMYLSIAALAVVLVFHYNVAGYAFCATALAAVLLFVGWTA